MVFVIEILPRYWRWKFLIYIKILLIGLGCLVNEVLLEFKEGNFLSQIGTTEKEEKKKRN